MKSIDALVIAGAFVVVGVAMGRRRRPSRRVTALTCLLALAVSVPSAFRLVRRALDISSANSIDHATLGALGSRQLAGAVPKMVPLSKVVVARVRQSIVKIVGDACGQRLSGTGWVIEQHLVATNAHVIAGVSRPEVVDRRGKHHFATVVAFDADLDVAMLRVNDLGAPSLPLVEDRSSREFAVFGHPHGRPLRVAPAALEPEPRIDGVGADIYGHGNHHRPVVVLAVRLAPGDSGSPVVNTRGEAIAMAFAIDPHNEPIGYALDASAIRDAASSVTGHPFSTSKCLS